MPMSKAETVIHARACYTRQAAERRAEYARNWANRSNQAAAVYFRVGLRTIGRWRQQLGLSSTYTRRGPA